MKPYFIDNHTHEATHCKVPGGCVVVICCMIVVYLSLNMSLVAYANPESRMAVNIGSKLVSCDAQVHYDQQHLAKVLREGAEITVSWEITVGEHRKYWFKRTVATLDVKRQVIPDLVSRSWLLVDITSGISQRVFSLDQAIQFLTHLQHFPVIDRSILSSGHRYRMDITANEIEGDGHRNWISTWMDSNRIVLFTEFRLP